jgi:hypothetical protein
MATAPLNPLVDKVRAKFPGEYDDMDDATLTKAVLAKYPEYSDLAAPPLSAAPGAPPKTLDSGEGPVAQGMTTFERKFADMPGQLWGALRSSWMDKPTPDTRPNNLLQNSLDDVKSLNPIAKNEGNTAMNVGATAANLLPLVVDPAGGGIMESPIAKIASAAKGALPPSTAEAGKLFQPIEAAAKSTPVDSSPARAIAEEAKKYADAGATGPPKVLSRFLARTADSAPMDPQSPVFYPEARKFAENAGRLSVTEKLATNPQMQRLVGKFADALRTANRAAADQVGMADQYDQAMKTYAGAAGREKMLANLGDVAKKAAIAYVGYEGLHRIISAAQK